MLMSPNADNFGYSIGRTLRMSSVTLPRTMAKKKTTAKAMSKEEYDRHQKLISHLTEAIEYFAKKKYGYSPTDNALGVSIGKSPSLFRNWKGGTWPRLDALSHLAVKLNCEVWELLHPDIAKLREDLARADKIKELMK